VQGFAPPATIEAPPRIPYPFGIFSVVPFAEQGLPLHWQNGIQWEALACDNTSWAVGECDAPTNWPQTWPNNPGLATAAAFTALGMYKCTPIGNSIDSANKKAQAILEAREQYLAEKRLWEALALNVTTVVGADYVAAVGQLEQFIADHYGAQGVIHASRRAAATLGQQGFLTDKGGQLRTVLGTPVIAGGGYPGTGARTTETQRVMITGGPTGGSFTLTLPGIGTTAAIAWNATAQGVADAINALTGIQGVTATGGALPGTPVDVSFGGEQEIGTDIPQMTATNSLTGGTTPAVAVTTTAAGGDATPTAGHEFVMASPAIFGYRSSDYYNFSDQFSGGDLLDRSLNNLYGLAARDYLFGWEPCGVAMVDVTLGAEAGV
jgi:hypothetical protein